MSEMKPSGIRPPSKIGHPTCTVTPKPAIPPSPPRSINSMESIPEIPDRRLSETGARRGSDNSVVLTEDTDSFIIGDHVWVGGTKPGQIAYIGETQFAPGDWAGIVLDEPIGKNDGSVAGCRYFQCEPKRGIFSRLTRLTRLPMSGAITSPSTPTESVKGSLNKSMSPSLNTSTTSLASVTHQKELQLGERVIVSSGQGSKTGVLRFMGTTDFAPGEWCGVELDEPLGKNDGSVGDKRYFECRPKHGLFAPAHKVSRSPSSKRSMAPSVHRPMGASLNASLARSKAGSRESLASMSSMASAVSRATTTASTARLQRPGLMRTSTPVRKTPQETLKDKQKEIEALRKERDLERERMTKAASQADAAEKTVIILKKEYEKYREEAEKAAQETQNTLAKLLEERNLFSTQLEEERRKCEDLLFRFEEESINKDDIQKENTEQSVANTIHENKIKDLEKQLSEERERVIQLERDSTKLFEVEEELTKLRTEIQNSAANEKSELSGLEKRNVDLEKLRGQLEKLLDEKNKTVAQYVTEIDEINKRLKEKEQENISQEEYKSNLRKQLEEITKELQEKLAYIDEFQNQFKGQTENLQKEIKGLKETIQNISEQNASERIKLIEEHKKILQSKEEILKSKASELKNESQKLFASHEGTLEQLKLENSRQIKELSESFKSQLNVKDTYIKQISSQLDEKVLNINNISIELSELKDACIAKENEIQKVSTDLEDLNIKLKGYDDKNCSLNKEIERLQIQHEDNIKTVTEQKAKLEGEVSSLATEIDSLKNKMKKLDECLKIKDLELSKIRNSKNEELESLKVQFEEKLEDKSKYIQEVKAEASEKSSRLIVLETELENLKSVVATKDEEIQNLSKKTSELRDALTLSEETKTNLESELKMYESNFAELNQKFDRAEGKISQLTNQKEKLEVEISTIVNTSMDSSEQLVKYNEDLRQKEKELDEARDREFNLQKLISTAESKSNATEEELNKANLLIDQFKLENEEIQTKLLSTEHELQALSAKILVNQTTEQKLIKTNKDFEESLNKRSAELADLRNSLKTYENNNLQLQKDLADAIEQYNKEKLQFERQIGEGENDQIALKENILTLEQLNKQLLTDQQGMESSVKELKQKISDKNTYLLELESLIKSKDVQIKENIANLECFKLEKEELKKNTLDLSTKYNDILTELTLLKSSNISLETQMSLEVANLKQQLEDEKNTLDTALKESKNSLDELTKELVTVSESEAKSSQKRLELESIIVTKEKEIQVLNEVLNSEKQNTETIKKDLQTLNETIAEKNNDILSNASLISSLKQKIVTTESSISTLKDDLENKIKFVAELQNRLDDMEQLNIDTANIDDKKREREIDELKKKYEHQLMSKDGVITELNGVIENREKIVQEFTSQQKSANELIKNYEEELVFKDKIIVDLKTVNETTKNANKDYENTKRLVDELTLKHADEIKLKDKVISELQEAAKEVNERIQNFIEQINFANERCSQLEETQRQRENDYKQLEISYNEAIAKLNIMKENIKNSTNNDLSNHKVLNLKTEENVKSTIGGSNSELEHFKEEYALARSQIEFLNSVIVEMQRKNEALLCKVEVLEMGIPTEEADDYNLNLIEKKTQSCRMFCDICDQFDLHESEDCPRQAQDAEPPPRPINSEKKLPKPRPYCENCEIFGHDTSACKDTETY